MEQNRKKNVVDAILSRYGINREDVRFLYMILGRLKSDCEYYLGWGMRNESRLWAQDENTHIKLMRAIRLLLKEKPIWLTIEDIGKYSSQMICK